MLKLLVMDLRKGLEREISVLNIINIEHFHHVASTFVEGILLRRKECR